MVMDERGPKSIDPRELGTSADLKQIPESSGRPTVLRNSRGQIIWRLPVNDFKQNEQLGIRNFQGLFLENFPDFERMFPRDEDGTIAFDYRQEASRFIHEAVANPKFKLLTLSVKSRVSTPYFEGSYPKAVQKSFELWGIKIVLMTARERSRLVPMNQVTSEERWVTLNALKQQCGIDFRTLSQHLKGLRTKVGKGLNGHVVVLYNEAEALAILTPFVSKPMVDPKEGKYIDEKGRAWTTLKRIGGDSFYHDESLKELMRDVPVIEGRASTGVAVTLYDEAIASERLSAYSNIPRADVSGRYADKDGRVWLAIGNLADAYGISKATIKKILPESLQLMGKSESGSRCILCAEIEAGNYLRHFVLNMGEEPPASLANDELVPLPQASRETGEYTDTQGESWIAATSFVRHFGMTAAAITKDRLDGVRYIEGRGVNGQFLKLYNTRELMHAFKELLDSPAVNKETGEFVDEEGNVWANKSYFCSRYGIGSTTIEPYLEGVTPRIAKGVNGVLINLYPKEIISQRLEKVIRLHPIDRQTRLYVDEHGESWATIQYFVNKYGVSRDAVKSRFAALPTLPGRDASNRSTTLYKVSDGGALFEGLLALPRTNQSQRFVDDENQSWVTINILRHQYNAGEKAIARLLREVAHMTGRDSIGNTRLLFNETDALKIIGHEQGISFHHRGDIQESSPLPSEKANEWLKELLQEED